MLKEVGLTDLRRRLAEVGSVEAIPETESAEWGIHGMAPTLSCIPSTAEGMAAALVACDQAGAAVIPLGGRTQRRLGLPPERADVVLMTSGLNRLLEYEPGDLTVTVEAGMRFSELQLTLAGKGQWLPLDPPLLPGATAGGLVATNVSGPRRLKEGGVRDLVIGTRVARPDGTLTRAGGRVVKNVTGYDLNKSHIGGLGTLGVVVEVTFKVSPRHETERSCFATFSSSVEAGETVAALARRPLAPSAMEILNHRMAREVGLPVPSDRWVLLGRASGFRPAVDRHMSEFDVVAGQCGALQVGELDRETGATVWGSYGDCCARWRWSEGALTCRMALPPASSGRVAEQVDALGGEVSIWAHATGALFVAEAMPTSGMIERVTALRGVAEAAGGYLVVENWVAQPGLKPSPGDVWGRPGGPLALMQAIKREYDPRRTINPGRFVGGI